MTPLLASLMLATTAGFIYACRTGYRTVPMLLLILLLSRVVRGFDVPPWPDNALVLAQVWAPAIAAEGVFLRRSSWWTTAGLIASLAALCGAPHDTYVALPWIETVAVVGACSMALWWACMRHPVRPHHIALCAILASLLAGLAALGGDFISPSVWRLQAHVHALVLLAVAIVLSPSNDQVSSL
jgi:hypothetical protein